MFWFQVAVPPAQPAQHRQRRQAQLLAAEAAGPETAEAESCCHPSHCEYPAGEGRDWELSLCLVRALPLGSVVCVRVARMCSSLGMASGPRRAVPGRCEPPARQGAPCAERVPSCWSSSASSIWMSLELFYQKIVGGLDRKSCSLPHDCCLPLL